MKPTRVPIFAVCHFIQSRRRDLSPGVGCDICINPLAQYTNMMCHEGPVRVYRAKSNIPLCPFFYACPPLVAHRLSVRFGLRNIAFIIYTNSNLPRRKKPDKYFTPSESRLPKCSSHFLACLPSKSQPIQPGPCQS